MRCVQLNLARDVTLTDPAQLLDRYHTLTGWSRAVATAGADVAVVQRFSRAAALTRGGVPYAFVDDEAPAMLPSWTSSAKVVDAVAQLEPDVVHVNGLMFPAMTLALRQRLGDACVIVLQDHSGAIPRTHHILRSWTTRRWGQAFREADACSFTARELAARWHAVGLPPDLPVIEMPEASTDLTPMTREEARARTGITGAPAVLWVGRMSTNKDPGTVLTGFGRALDSLPDARCSMIVPSEDDRRSLQLMLSQSAALRRHVEIMGPVAHPDMALYYSAADILLSGSHHEGSGYAVIEALACGVTPCVTDIPSFRALAADCGVFWRAGDPDDCARALIAAASRVANRRGVREHFESRLSWSVIGARTVEIYARLLAARRHSR